MNDDTVPVAPLRLQAMTLRGIGSYLDGTRLEFGPLTILCGENGAGKSTWLRVLDILADSMDDPEFPFEIRKDVKSGNYLLLNGHYVQTYPENYPVPSGGDEEDFGALGTIGFEFTAETDVTLGEPEDAGELAVPPGLQDLATLVQTGRYNEGERFQILLTPRNPQITEFISLEGRNPPGYQDWYEAQRFGLEIRARNSRVRVIRSYTCDDVVITWQSAASDRPGQMEVQWSELTAPERITPETRFFGLLLQRASEMLSALLSGYFHLGAFRLPEGRSSQRRDEAVGDGSRFVGPRGQFAHDLVSLYFLNPMRPPHVELTYDASTGDYGPTFTVYYNTWLRFLLNIGCDYEYVSDPDSVQEWPTSAPMPAPFMASLHPQLHPEIPESGEAEDFTRYTGPTFRSTSLHAHPGNFSSGFHQIAPMIVQTGLMRENEIFAVENPEVHLHPECQVKTIEFLMSQATSGRQIVIETHSDLLVKRTLRALVEGEVLGHPFPRETVNIMFASLREKDDGVVDSELTPIELDSIGYVRNWPEGFMDTNIRETELLADRLYGDSEEDDVS